MLAALFVLLNVIASSQAAKHEENICPHATPRFLAIDAIEAAIDREMCVTVCPCVDRGTTRQKGCRSSPDLSQRLSCLRFGGVISVLKKKLWWELREGQPTTLSLSAALSAFKVPLARPRCANNALSASTLLVTGGGASPPTGRRRSRSYSQGKARRKGGRKGTISVCSAAEQPRRPAWREPRKSPHDDVALPLIPDTPSGSSYAALLERLDPALISVRWQAKRCKRKLCL